MPASEACLDLKKKGNEAIGKKDFEAAIEACKLRLRPILMTSFAFILGVVPFCAIWRPCT